MHFTKALATLTLLLGSTEAAPVASNATTSPAVIFERGAKSVNDCEKSTFYNATSAASPLIDDCLMIAKNIQNGGTWTVDDIIGLRHQLVQYGTCAFSAEGIKGNMETYFYVGNQDIMDLIKDSIRLFGASGKVGSWGRMYCQGGAPTYRHQVTWGIYHNS